MLSIGLMSGTSMDGIDAALLETDGSAIIKELGHASITYSPEFKILLKAAEYAVRHHHGIIELAERDYVSLLFTYLQQELQIPKNQLQTQIKHLSQYFTDHPAPLSLAKIIQHSTDLHEQAVRKLLQKTGYQTQQIDVIGYHGQTLFHQPSLKRSIIVGLGQYLANHLGITVINDFRRCDLENGGQGAPFAPLYHHALVMKMTQLPTAVVNCGGIANITFINSQNILDLIAFDTGPGNGLIDRLIRNKSQGKENMDRDGRYGGQGYIDKQTLAALYEKAIIKNKQNYFLLPPPKSLDIGDLQLIAELNALSLEDACATLEAFTADSIVKSLDWLSSTAPQQWILAGGGWNNPVIDHQLKERLTKKLGKNIKILHAKTVGWDSQALEAQIFAYFAVRSLQNKPLSVPGTTQVHHPVSGGQVYLPITGATIVVQELIATHPAVLSRCNKAASITSIPASD